ncbi:MAG: arylsulfatase [Verrucomicrobiales bacterium]|nr:arylsulfatase [Verrucomicrobiales bacterium]
MSHFLAFISASLIIFGTLPATHSSEKRPNIIFFLIDDLGWSDLGCYGSKYHLTPNIDKLAAGGIRFSQAYSASPVCSPTRSAVMTGKNPARLGITDWIGASQKFRVLVTPKNTKALPQNELTFAESLNKSGYATAYFGKWHLGADDKDHPSSQGFEYHRGVNRAGSPGSYYYPFKRNKNSSSTNVPDFDSVDKDSYLTDLLAEEASKFIEKKKDVPFLLMLSHYSVHTPIQARKNDSNRYKDRMKDIGLSSKISIKKEKYGNTRMTQNNPDYAAMVESVDRSVGKVLDKLEELKIKDNTLVIFTSDNGGLSTLQNGRRPGPTSCLPLRAGKGWLYEGGIRVPAILAWPGVIGEGITIDVPIISMDFYPTILTVAGIKLDPSQHRDGLDLNSIFRDKELPSRALFWHYPHYHGSGNRPSSAIRKGNYKLIRWHEDGSEEMFDIAKDISETADIAKDEPAKRKELAKDLSRWIESSGSRMPKKNPER